MDISVGLPTTVPGVDGPSLTGFARRAEAHGFAGLGVLDRLVYDNYEPLIALAAAAAVTERIRLTTSILIASYRPSATLLAKQLATIDHISGGRLSVGLAAGGREDDYLAAGTTYHDRGRRLDAIVAELRAVWADEGRVPGIGPTPPKGAPRLLFGGHSPAAMRRAAAHGDGWIAGGGSVTAYADLVRQSLQAWADAGREGRPHLVSLCYVSLGPDGAARAGDYLRHYYSYVGPKAEYLARGVIADGGRLRDAVAGYAEAGCDELILFPCVPEPAQVDLLAEAVPR
ncbi:LLM class flavin-dependent oxidoreductase [Actinophytocola sp.]|uniref:LLM class flavin-dependent oxidoreductase n=1 Tax=Actinophytocola sp. TaxID=1872138 RepID=UPI002D809F6F|nr:LLM class flavin-dependent oxidoreductase [Actinophytocola sp.]HET9141289.1 LLM class flavin-dependent oxidoreductase [Actinophytocola sp.]